MWQISYFSTCGHDRRVPLRSAILYTSKAKPLVGDATKGSQQTPQPDDSLLATEEANEARTSELRSAMDAAAAAGDVATYKQHQAEYTKALAARNPERIHQLNEQHLAALERAVALGVDGLRCVPAARLESATGRAVAWRTSRPVADEADRRATA